MVEFGPLLILFAELRSIIQTGWSSFYIALGKKLLDSVKVDPHGLYGICSWLALGFPGLKHFTGTINCSCFCQDAGLSAFYPES